VIAWSTEKNPAHGSLPRAASRFGTVSTVKASGFVFAESSAQASGVETGAPGFARGEYAATAVAPRTLRR
jgi:hypothetical protein